jgi:hypothetical protein
MKPEGELLRLQEKIEKICTVWLSSLSSPHLLSPAEFSRCCCCCVIQINKQILDNAQHRTKQGRRQSSASGHHLLRSRSRSQSAVSEDFEKSDPPSFPSSLPSFFSLIHISEKAQTSSSSSSSSSSPSSSSDENDSYTTSLDSPSSSSSDESGKEDDKSLSKSPEIQRRKRGSSYSPPPSDDGK